MDETDSRETEILWIAAKIIELYRPVANMGKRMDKQHRRRRLIECLSHAEFMADLLADELKEAIDNPPDES
jgi:hypothetical protein